MYKKFFFLSFMNLFFLYALVSQQAAPYKISECRQGKRKLKFLSQTLRTVCQVNVLAMKAAVSTVILPILFHRQFLFRITRHRHHQQ
jgi:hypothetical protein